jgi:DNA phosphorothioation-dependent restriction protein DptH
MNPLARFLAQIVREVTRQRLGQVQSRSREERLVFLGPPLEILNHVFDLLQPDTADAAQPSLELPVLLQVPKHMLAIGNPAIGKSGWCDHGHLLTVRDTASAPSFLALVPPDQHMDLSVATTVDVFGVSSKASSGIATFEEWWADPFVQQVATAAIDACGLMPDVERARRLIEAAARSADEIDSSRTSRTGAWRVLSRIFSCSTDWDSEPPAVRLSAACGMPPTDAGDLNPETQLKALSCIAGALEDGFKAGIDRAIENAPSEEVRDSLEEFRNFIQGACDIPTVFERAPSAHYATSKGTITLQPPEWWKKLTAERWVELLEDSGPGRADVAIEVLNPLNPVAISGLVVVLAEAELRLSSNTKLGEIQSITLERRVGSGNKGLTSWDLRIDRDPVVQVLEVPPHKAPVRFIALSQGQPAASVKVISMATWDAGVHVQCRTASKLTPAKRQAKPSVTKPSVECSLVLEGPGRHLVDVYVSPGVRLRDLAAQHGQDDDSGLAEVVELPVRKVSASHYNVEVDAGGDCDLELILEREGGPADLIEACRVHLSCAEVRVTGCTSEFDRLVRENRGVRRASVQVDRVVRCSVLESWLLDEASAARSCMPIVLAEDYSSAWAQLKWDSPHGPLVSSLRFISDPRPSAQEWSPPAKMIATRVEILRRIRGDDNSGLTAQATLGRWLETDAGFRDLVETYLDSYMEWWSADPSTACWSDVIAIGSPEPGTETLSPKLDAVLLTPLHPVRLAWQCVAQASLSRALEGGMPCPAAALLDPDVVPDLLQLSVRGPDGIEHQTFVAVECSSDYWGVLWNAESLAQLGMRSRRHPFGQELGITVGGLARGFSPSQVAKALNDVADLLPAKPVLSISLSSSGVGVDSCNEGIADWSKKQFGEDSAGAERARLQLGVRLLEVHDSRPASARPDEPTLSNLVEDTGGAVRWFLEGRRTSAVDLAVITQLEASQPTLSPSPERSALSAGGLLRHRVRRQLPQSGQAYLVESRHSVPPEASGSYLIDKLGHAIARIENAPSDRRCFRFAPDVRAIKQALENEQADFVAVSSSAVDPGCFVGDWLKGAYLWDYSLPSYSQRAGDTCGSYLISSIKEVDRDALTSVISQLGGSCRLDDHQVDGLLHEVARRGIPTVREISGDDSKAAGALGMFVAARVLQDAFRTDGGTGGMLPVMRMVDGHSVVTVVVPIDPFVNHIEELSRAVKAGKEGAVRRPDLLIASCQVTPQRAAVKLVPLEVKFRSGQPMTREESSVALSQAKALAALFQALKARSESLLVWRVALGHLVLSMLAFGIRIYGQNKFISQDGRDWSALHESLASAILSGSADLQVDERGRLIVVDSSPASGPSDRDDDGFPETVVISLDDASRVIAGDPLTLYQAMRQKLGDWDVLPAVEMRSQASLSVRESSPTPPAKANPVIGAAAAMTTATPSGDDLVFGTTEPPPIQPTLEGDIGELSPELSATPIGVDQAGSGIILEIGTSTSGFEARSQFLNLSDTRLNQLNIGVVGDLGTGKTQLLKSLIHQVTSAANANRGIKPRFLIFDYKKDYSSPDFVQAVGAKVVRPHRMPLNIFDTTGMVDSMVPWLDRFKFFADVLDKIFSGIGPVQRDKLKQAVKKAYEAAEGQGRMPTLNDVHAEYRLILSGKADAPLAIIDDLVDSEVFAADPPAGASFGAFFDGVVVVSLAAMGQDDRSKNMVVALMLNMFYEHMLALPKRPFVGSDPQLRAIDSYLLVDEADNIMQYEFDVLRKLLLQGREFGVGVVLASQYLRHFKVNATDYREPLLTWFIHKVPNVTASELAGLGLTADVGELAERVKGLQNHHCLFKSFGGHAEVVRGMPFFELVTRKSS